MEVARWFVRDEKRQERLKAQLGAKWLSFYLGAVGLFADLAGEPDTALTYNLSCEAIDRQARDRIGRLRDAVRHATDALEVAIRVEADDEIRDRHAFLAFAASLRGELEMPAKAFAEANIIEGRLYGEKLCSVRGIWWAEYLLRSGQTTCARKLTMHNRELCGRNRWQGSVARCEWMLGWLDVVETHWTSARNHLDHAEATFTRGHMIHELARVHLTRAACHLGERHLEPALAACERALDLAAPRKFRLIHSDALVLRARIALVSGDAATARNDAESALQIAEPSEYAWAERDACEVLAQAWGSLVNVTEAARYAHRAAILNHRLIPTAEIRGLSPQF